MRKWHWVLLGLMIVLMLGIPEVLPNYFLKLFTLVLIFSIVSLSIDLLLGYTGLGVMGHAAYFAIGAYATGILVTRYNTSFLTTLFFATAAGGILSAFFGLLLLRTKGVFFFMISLSVTMIIWGIAYRWTSLTGGENGIISIPRPDLGIGADMGNPVSFYYFVSFFFVVILLFMILLVKSPYGKSLVGIRDSTTRMSVLGYNVWLHKYMALILGGMIAAIGGNLYAYYNGFVGPTTSNIGMAMEFLLMVIIGGPGTLFGSCIGAFIIVFMREIISIFTERWLLLMGVVYMITAMYAPKGIIGLWHSLKEVVSEKKTVAGELSDDRA